MSAQIGFYTAHDDFRTLTQMTEDLGLVAIPASLPTLDAEQHNIKVTSPSSLDMPPRDVVFYLLPSSLAIAEAFYFPIPSKPELSRLRPSVSPVIEFRPYRPEGNRLSAGRLYLDSDPSDPRNPVVRKAYDALVRRIRRWPRLGHNYIGPATLELARAGKLTLMVGRHELPVDEVPGAGSGAVSASSSGR